MRPGVPFSRKIGRRGAQQGFPRRSDLCDDSRVVIIVGRRVRSPREMRPGVCKEVVMTHTGAAGTDAA